jgi:outer membrane biosynthesis protein TonB
MPHALRAALAAALLSLAACASAGIKVVRTSDEKLPPKPADCALEFLLKAPPQPYDELAELDSHVTSPPPNGALEVLRPKACELGADAVIVRRNFVTNEFGHVLVAGTAIKYRAEAAPEAPPAEAPPAQPTPEPAPEPQPAPQPQQPGAPTNL